MNEKIMAITKKYLKNPKKIKIKAKELTVENIDQIAFQTKNNMKDEITTRVIDLYKPEKLIVFCNTKKKVDQLHDYLKSKKYNVDVIHGDIKQDQRDRTIKKFKKGDVKILIATDVAARGIDKTRARRKAWRIPESTLFLLAIIGGSGSGKSTFLRLLIGLIKPTSGQILIDGQDIVPMSEAELNKVRLKMGMVFQYSALFDSMTVGENVAFGLREHTKLSDADIKEIVREKLHLVGLDGVEDMMPNELSGGMKKRVSLARAIAVEPSIICYDEPSSGLDPLMTEKIDELIINTQKALSVTSIVVTHDMASACRISDRIAMIYDGELIAVDTVERFKKIKDARVQAFFRTLRTVKSEKEDER